MRAIKLTILATAAAAVFGTPAWAQQEMNFPRGQNVPYRLDSGLIVNQQKQQDSLFSEIVHVEGALWLRLYFGDTMLGAGSYLRVTSLLDQEQQILDAATLSMWSNTTAYFNGDSVLLELISGGASKGDRVMLDMVAAEIGFGAQPITNCGTCVVDDRVPSNVDYAGRLMPVGCSAAVYTVNSCLVSAGHCVGGANIIQFKVPNSTAGCNLQNPPVAEQFPVTGSLFTNGGVGNDWSVMTTGVNNLNQTIVQRYGEFRPIAPAIPGNGTLIDVWGYGVSKTCTLTQTQQRSPGNINGGGGGFFTHNADTTGGNSGSGIFFNNSIIGIATHCGCPTNVGQRVDLAAFVNARAQLCPNPPPINDDCANATTVAPVGSTAFTNAFATTDGPNEPGACTVGGYTQIGADVWYKFLANCTGTATASVCGSTFNTKIAAYAGCPGGSGLFLACNDDFCGTSSQISFPVQQGTVYRIRIGGFNATTGTGMLALSCTPAPPQCPADTNGDNLVNVNDLLAVINAWGPCVGCAADINNDNIVNVNDLLAVINAWGPCQ